MLGLLYSKKAGREAKGLTHTAKASQPLPRAARQRNKSQLAVTSGIGWAVNTGAVEHVEASRFPRRRSTYCDSAWVIHRKPVQKPTRKLGKPQEHMMEEDYT